MAYAAFVSLPKRLQVVIGKAKFMSHSRLAYDHSSNTECLVDDHLKVRVDAVFYSTPLLSLTPAWQLISIHSGAHFTISEYSKRKQFNNEHYSPPFTSRPQATSYQREINYIAFSLHRKTWSARQGLNFQCKHVKMRAGRAGIGKHPGTARFALSV